MILFVLVVLCFFFFKQKTAYEMRISDWSSDVCSSDLCLASHMIRKVTSYRSSLTRSAWVPTLTEICGAPGMLKLRGAIGCSKERSLVYWALRPNRGAVSGLNPSGGMVLSVMTGGLSLSDTGDRKSTRLNSSH